MTFQSASSLAKKSSPFRLATQYTVLEESDEWYVSEYGTLVEMTHKKSKTRSIITESGIAKMIVLLVENDEICNDPISKARHRKKYAEKFRK